MIWTGHDPSPEIEYVGESVRIWRDRKTEGEDYVEFGKAELDNLLKKVESDLKGFLFRLEQWVEYVSPGLSKTVTEHFSKNIDI